MSKTFCNDTTINTIHFMKKILVLAFVFVCASFTAIAQSKIYCELLGTQGFLTKKVTISIDFGQQTKLFSDNRLVDDKGEVIVFNSMIDAMNYMGKLGWEFEQAYVVTLGAGSGAQNVYHWLLSKYVGDEGDNNSLKTVQMLNQENKEQKASTE